MKLPQFLNGTVVNLSEVEMLVAETTTNAGKVNKLPCIVHRLKPGYRSPKDIDADGLKRADGIPIDGHPYWIQFRNPFTATVTGTAQNLKVDVLFRILGLKNQFGDEEIDPNPEWGERIQKITHVIKEKKKTVGYVIDGYIRVSKDEAISTYRKGYLINVTLVHMKTGLFLRTLPDHDSSNNLAITS